MRQTEIEFIQKPIPWMKILIRRSHNDARLAKMCHYIIVKFCKKIPKILS